MDIDLSRAAQAGLQKEMRLHRRAVRGYNDFVVRAGAELGAMRPQLNRADNGHPTVRMKTIGKLVPPRPFFVRRGSCRRKIGLSAQQRTEADCQSAFPSVGT